MRGWRERFSDYRMPRRTRLVVTVVLAVATGAATVLGALLTASAGVFPPVDYDVFGPAGADVLTGRWDRVFADPIVQAGPFELVFFGIPFLLGVDGVVGWTVFASVAGLLLSGALAVVVDRVVRPVSPDLAAPLGAGAALLATLTATISMPVLDGHPAQIAIPLLWVVAAMLARRGSALAAGAVLGATLGWELWGVLGAPVLLLAVRLDLRTFLRYAGGGAAAIVVLFGGFLLAGPVAMFGFAWPVRDGSLVHLLLPDAETFGWPLRLAQAVLSVGAGIAVAVVLRPRREALWLVPFAVCAVRLLTDPVLAGYYFQAPAVLSVIGLALAVAARAPLRIVAAFVLFTLTLGLASTGWVGPAVLVAAAIGAVLLVARGREPALA